MDKEVDIDLSQRNISYLYTGHQPNEQKLFDIMPLNVIPSFTYLLGIRKQNESCYSPIRNRQSISPAKIVKDLIGLKVGE